MLVQFQVSGIVYIQAQQNIAVYLNTGGSALVHSESGFSVAFLGPNLPHPGLHADQTGTSVTSKVAGWHELTNWQTTYTPTTGFYTTDASWSVAGSPYIVSVTGIYYVSANIRIDSASAASRLVIAINRKPDVNNGLHVIETRMPDQITLSVAGFVHVRTGDTISVFVYSDDTSYVVHEQSSFSINRQGSAFSRSAFLADLRSDVSMTAAGWYDLSASGWTTDGTNGLFQTDLSFDAKTGNFTAPTTGYYYIAANIRFDNTQPNAHYRVIVAVNNQNTFSHGLQAVRETGATVTTSSFSETVAGALYVTIGQTISIKVYGSRGPFSVSHESGFSICQLFNVQYGFQAALAGDAVISTAGTQRIVGSGVRWSTAGHGLFNQFTESGGYMVVPSDGTGVYVISAQVSNPKFD